MHTLHHLNHVGCFMFIISLQTCCCECLYDYECSQYRASFHMCMCLLSDWQDTESDPVPAVCCQEGSPWEAECWHRKWKNTVAWNCFWCSWKHQQLWIQPQLLWKKWWVQCVQAFVCCFDHLRNKWKDNYGIPMEVVSSVMQAGGVVCACLRAQF